MLKFNLMFGFYFVLCSCLFVNAANKSKDVKVINYPKNVTEKTKVYKVAVLMINTLTEAKVDNPKTKQLEYYTPEQLGEIFFNHQHGVRSYLQEASYGKIALEGTVVGWLNAPKKGLSDELIIKNPSEYISLANDYIKFKNYDIFVVNILADGKGAQIGWKFPDQSFKSPQGDIKNIGITWMINSEVFDSAPFLESNWSSGDAVLPTTSWSHELLHTFGINGHANSLDSGEEQLSLQFSENPLKAYGNPFSIMGEHAFAMHPDALMKNRLGWLTKDKIPEIKTSGTYEIYPLVKNDNQVKALVIPFSKPLKNDEHKIAFDALVVEYRTAEGFDRYLERLKGSTFLSQYSSLTNIDYNGVIVYLRYSSNETDGTVLLDMNPKTAYNSKRGIKWPGNVGKFADAVLPVNQTFMYENINITPTGVSKNGAMQVKVTINPPAKK